jgi:hypothetical protein
MDYSKASRTGNMKYLRELGRRWSDEKKKKGRLAETRRNNQASSFPDLTQKEHPEVKKNN